jgi:hypothetical protein
MLDGDGQIQPDLKDLPNPFVMSEHLEALMEGLDPEAPPKPAEGTQMFGWLPDLANAQVGMLKLCNEYQA